MKYAIIRQRIKPFMLPIAMLGGVLFHDFIDRLAFLAPYLIFIMLLITFCKVKPNEFRVTRLSWSLLAVQLGGSLIVYFALLPFSKDLAQGAFICVFCPTATAAPVITGMLGGSIPRLATFSIISNISAAITAPMLFSMMSSDTNVDFTSAMFTIGCKVVPLLIAPLLLAFFLLYTVPKVHTAIATRQSLSFYIWAVSLFIVVGRAVSFVISEPSSRIGEMLCIALASGIVCCLQFLIGRRIGRRCGDKIAGAQGLGQKNTVLAIWMALTYLNPISSVGPAAYVAWQNTINSWQLYRKARTGKI
jgi:BASS family bile acid:Na+ symporter